jgi:hypothetical protein
MHIAVSFNRTFASILTEEIDHLYAAKGVCRLDQWPNRERTDALRNIVFGNIDAGRAVDVFVAQKPNLTGPA